MGRDTRRGAVRQRLEHMLGAIRAVATRLTPALLRRSYLAKFVVAFLVVVLLMAAVGSTNYIAAKQTIESDATAQVESTAALQASTVAGWARTMKTHARAAASSEEVRGENHWRIRQHLFGVIRGATVDIVDIHYVDIEADSVVVGTNPSLQGDSLDAVDRPWANAASLENLPENQAGILTDGYVVDGSRTRVAFGARVPSDEMKYIVVIGSVERQIDRLARPSQHHSTALLDTERGTVVTNTSGWPATLALDDIEHPANLTTHIRHSHVLGVAPVSGTKWVLVSAVPTDHAFAVRSAVGWNVLLVVLTGLLSLALVGLVLGQQTVPPLVRLREKTERMEAGDLGVDLETTRRDELGQLYWAFASMRDSLQRQIQAAEDARDEAERERARTQAMNRQLIRAANEYSEIMRRCADGDLTRRFEHDAENEAMDRIAMEFNEMVEELEQTVGQHKEFAREVEAAGDVLQSSADIVRIASDHVADSVQNISDDAFEQKERLESISTEVDEVVATFDTAGDTDEADVEEPLERLEEIAARISEVAAISEQTLAETEVVALATEEQANELTAVSDQATDLTQYARALRDLLEEFDTESSHGLSIDEVDHGARSDDERRDHER